MSEKNLKLGTYLKELRMVKDLSLRAVEKKTNNSVSNAYLSQLESGDIAKPSPHILENLAEAYNVPYDDLMAVAGYIRSSTVKKSGVAFFNKNDITPDETKKLLEYLKLIRKHNTNK